MIATDFLPLFPEITMKDDLQKLTERMISATASDKKILGSINKKVDYEGYSANVEGRKLENKAYCRSNYTTSAINVQTCVRWVCDMCQLCKMEKNDYILCTGSKELSERKICSEVEKLPTNPDPLTHKAVRLQRVIGWFISEDTPIANIISFTLTAITDADPNRFRTQHSAVTGSEDHRFRDCHKSCIPSVAVYVDDIIISAGTDNEHLNRLHCKLQKLLDVGLKVKQDKYGPAIRANDEKVKAIQDIPSPNSQKQFRVFHGTVGFLQRFIPNIRCHCSGLYELTSSRIKWKWKAEHQKQFDNVKQCAFMLTELALRDATRLDHILSKVCGYLKTNWPYKIDELMQPYSCRRSELSTEGNIVLLGARVVVPSTLRKDVLRVLHAGHPGIVSMKALSRFYV
ncbi:hypothetical protein GJ496_002756 [Pomphorhynchus laevis]|nr:hypothetical protein GJ496_002756 [Pomphorhynchus laevis]